MSHTKLFYLCLLVITSFFQIVGSTPTAHEVLNKISEITSICCALKDRDQVFKWCDNQYNIACLEQFRAEVKTDVLAMFAANELNQPTLHPNRRFVALMLPQIITPTPLPLVIIRKVPQIYLQALNGSFVAKFKIFGEHKSEGCIELMFNLLEQQPDLLINFVQICQRDATVLKQLIANYPKSLLSETVRSCLQNPILAPLKKDLCDCIKTALVHNDLDHKQQAIYAFWLQILSPSDFKIWLTACPDQFCNAILNECLDGELNDIDLDFNRFTHQSPELFCYVCIKAINGTKLMELYQNKFPIGWQRWLHEPKNLRLLAQTVTHKPSHNHQKKQSFRQAKC